ncbi:MAG: response regulator [Patescibacteria group bacterium]
MEANQTAKKIFIVDDDKLLLEMYTLKFKEKGFEVTQAFGSIDALRKLKGGIIPDVMLLDVVAPTMDGFELFALIKNEKLAPNAKAIVLSNLGQPALAEKERALGVNGYVVKASANPSEVVEKVITILAEGEPLARED